MIKNFYKDKGFLDHSIFLSKRDRYSFLFKLDILDYSGWADGLKRAGYATDKNYNNKVIDIIHEYNLYKYDNEVIDKKKYDKNILPKNFRIFTSKLLA